MRKFAAVLSILAMVLTTGMAFAQREATGVSDQPAVAVVRGGVDVGPNMVEVVARHADGREFYRHISHNLKTYAGGDFIAAQMSGAGGTAVAKYIALSSDATAPAATDTAVTGEITLNGLGRAAATYSHTACSAFPCTYTLTYTWTATGSQASVQKAGVLTAASAGTLAFENTFTAVTLATNDTLQVTWTITLS